MTQPYQGIRPMLWGLVLGGLLLCPPVVSGQWQQDPPGGLPNCSADNCVAQTDEYGPATTSWTQSYNGDVFVWMTLIGAGGGGGGCTGAGATGGGGGGAGEMLYMVPLGHLPYNTTITFSIGEKGVGGYAANSYVGQDGQDTVISYNGVEIARAQGGKGGSPGVQGYGAGAVALGGDGGSGVEEDPVETGCRDIDEDGEAGEYDGYHFRGAGGGCGTINGESAGGAARWRNSSAVETSQHAIGRDGGGGGATVWGNGGAGGNAANSLGTGAVGGGGGGSASCVTTRQGGDAGVGKIIVYKVR